MERYQKVEESKKELIINNFIGGISWALGATVGLAIVVAILGIVVKNINFVPIVGNFVANVLSFVITKNPNLSIK